MSGRQSAVICLRLNELLSTHPLGSAAADAISPARAAAMTAA